METKIAPPFDAPLLPSKSAMMVMASKLRASVICFAIALGALGASPFAFGVSEISIATLRAKYATPESRVLTLKDGAVIHVREEGPLGAPVILMVPGLHSSLFVWDGWSRALRDTYRVVAVDLPGQGLSDSWPHNDYSISALDDFISEVTSALNISRFTFAGHSMAGAMAWRYALAHPERIEALILVSAGGFVTTGAGPILAFRVLTSPVVGPVSRRLITPFAVRSILKKSYGDPGKISDQLVTLNFEMINGAGHRASLPQRLDYLMSYEPVSRIDGIRVPTLIIWGDRDQLRPVVYATMFKKHIKDSALRVHQGIGHFPMEEVPDATAADVRQFMTRVR